MSSKFQRKPEYIEAFQMTEEVEGDKSMQGCPDWAKECRQQDPRTIGAIFSTDPDNSSKGLTLKTSYGEFPIPIKSWVIKNDVNFMIVADDHFKASFEPIDKTTAKPKTDEKTKQSTAVTA